MYWPCTLTKPRLPYQPAWYSVWRANHDLLMLLDIPLNGVMTEELPSAKITRIINLNACICFGIWFTYQTK